MVDVAEILDRDGIVTDGAAKDRMDAVGRAGDLLARLGAVRKGYREAMIEREAIFSSYLGEGVAIPHGTDESRALVERTALVYLRFPEGVDWDGERVTVCIGIAARGDEHMEVLGGLARVLGDPERAAALRAESDPDEVLAIIRGAEEG